MNLLYRYVIKSLDRDKFNHEAELKSKIIHEIFQRYCDDIDLVPWIQRDFKPVRTYDVVFDIRHLQRLEAGFHEKTVKILFLNASNDAGRNLSELKRINEINDRRGGELTPKRQIEHPESVLQSLEIADVIILTGNRVTLETYPEKYWDKIQLIDTITTSEAE